MFQTTNQIKYADIRRHSWDVFMLASLFDLLPCFSLGICCDSDPASPGPVTFYIAVLHFVSHVLKQESQSEKPRNI